MLSNTSLAGGALKLFFICSLKVYPVGVRKFIQFLIELILGNLGVAPWIILAACVGVYVLSRMAGGGAGSFREETNPSSCLAGTIIVLIVVGLGIYALSGGWWTPEKQSRGGSHASSEEETTKPVSTTQLATSGNQAEIARLAGEAQREYENLKRERSLLDTSDPVEVKAFNARAEAYKRLTLQLELAKKELVPRSPPQTP